MGYRQACKEFGFFYLQNHGVPEGVTQQVFQEAKAFFSLGQEYKLIVRADQNNRGFTPMHEEVLDPGNQTKGGTKVRMWLLVLLILLGALPRGLLAVAAVLVVIVKRFRWRVTSPAAYVIARFC